MPRKRKLTDPEFRDQLEHFYKDQEKLIRRLEKTISDSKGTDEEKELLFEAKSNIYEALDLIDEFIEGF